MIEVVCHQPLNHVHIRAAGIAEDRKGPLFRTTRGRSGELTGNACWALATGIKTGTG